MTRVSRVPVIPSYISIYQSILTSTDSYIYLPYKAKDIWLRKLYDYTSTTQLMTRVSRVPVIPSYISIYQSILTSTDSYIYLPYTAKDIWLRKLYDYTSTTQLMTRVSGVPVILSYISIYQCILTSTDSYT